MSSSFCIFPVQRKGAVRGQNAALYREREDMSMISEKMKPLVNNNSAIRAMFEEGKRLANVLQETIKEEMGDGNHRVEKANDSYYMLKKSSGPFVIIECGFLSNPEEEKLLISEEYQQKMAKAVAEGIEKFLYNE